jgi:hypothetical protein
MLQCCIEKIKRHPVRRILKRIAKEEIDLKNPKSISAKAGRREEQSERAIVKE